jgi:hypothetical protein
MYTPAGTSCAVSGNALPAEWNRIPAATSLAAA